MTHFADLNLKKSKSPCQGYITLDTNFTMLVTFQARESNSAESSTLISLYLISRV